MRRMLLKEYIDIIELKDMVDVGNIKKVIHPTLPLVLYNYTQECQANGVWNDTTKKCRGLVVNSDTGEILARPYTKFFNYEEYVAINKEYEIPSNLPYTITEKMDGSLGILFWYDDEPYIITKNSFVSVQGKHATKMIRSMIEKNNGLNEALNHEYTYLFEIVFPEDKLCISYGDTDDLFLHGIININTGEELNLKEEVERIYNECGFRFTAVKEYDGMDWRTIRDIVSDTNKEGFVVKFSNGFRLKIKYESYWRIHYFRSGFNNKMILAALMEGGTAIDDLKSKMKLYLDEENELIGLNRIKSFQARFDDINSRAYAEYKAFKPIEINGKLSLSMESVDYYKSCTYPHLEFALAKGKNITKLIWKMIKGEI